MPFRIRTSKFFVLGGAALCAMATSCSDGNGDPPSSSPEKPDASSQSRPDAASPAASRPVGGTVRGLRGTLVLRNNGDDEVTVTKNGTFIFGNRVEAGGRYDVKVGSQPDGQTCSVANGSGTVGDADVTDVTITCADDVYAIGGNVSGLDGTLVLSNNDGDDLSVSANGPFAFTKRVPKGSEYAVTVRTQPGKQQCTVAKGSGNATSDVSDVSVTCVRAYSVGGNVTGLTGTLVLENNGGDALTVNTNGAFTFATSLVTSSPYAVTVRTQPQNQICSVTDGSGTIAAADVSNVTVTCAPTFGVGGTVSGLAAGSVVLQVNGGGDVTVNANGSFDFASRLVDGSSYEVTVLKNPTGQFCAVTGATGTVTGGAVNNVSVACRLLSVVVNEVYARPATGAYGDTNGDGIRDSANDEFVEILNNEAFAVDIGNWVLRTGTGTPAAKFTFPAGTSLAAGGRAIVFGGGTPTGSFGGALTFTSALSLTDAPTADFFVRLDSLTAAGATLDTFTYGAAAFGSSCTTGCASQVRSPEGTGPFVAHTTVSGSTGILWSPGVAAPNAIPKLNALLSYPALGATAATVKSVDVQLNMFATAADFDNTQFKLFASPCAALANEVTSFATIGALGDASRVRLLPTNDLAYATTHCMSIAGTARSANGTPFGAPASYEFTTRTAASVPAGTVVISEYGGCRTASTAGLNACTAASSTANDEFVELHNPTAVDVDISGWFLQRRTAGGSASCAATIPPGTTLRAHGYFLIGGAGYTSSRYAGNPTADLSTTVSLFGGTGTTGTAESLVLSNAATCTGAPSVVDAVSAGAITDSLTTLSLPAFPTPAADGQSLERKACFDSTGDAKATTGLLAGGGHEAQGNSERFGASHADWVLRASPNPQNSTSATETRSCP
ncbi:PUTATIVE HEMAGGLUTININ-RELATED Protein [Labilithrix luteola]|uniref:PUTATIVE HEMAGGLUTININ-RELATED Protein n=1 Tax=Labilithrix luteola TaxID=1391654 RepID=A0A0K1PR11_9BACT|nr:lamin tail domain-containing protein [Labilithrix luteola]AKU95962.1 PUTATIVE HEMAGGLUTININ-RELATED Protein [Labilithrix luteola]